MRDSAVWNSPEGAVAQMDADGRGQRRSSRRYIRTYAERCPGRAVSLELHHAPAAQLRIPRPGVLVRVSQYARLGIRALPVARGKGRAAAVGRSGRNREHRGRRSQSSVDRCCSESDGLATWAAVEATKQEIRRSRDFDLKRACNKSPKLRVSDSEGTTQQVRSIGPQSITETAFLTIDSGIVTPSALADLRLTPISNRVGLSTGRSPALAPLRILSTSPATRR